VEDLKDRWPRYFNLFILFSAVYLIGCFVLFSTIELAKFFEYRIDLIARSETASFVFIGSMFYVSILATAASIGYIAFSGTVRDFKWGWSLIILAAMFFNFTGFILLLFYFVCLRASKTRAKPVEQ
jgi:hypothetical protein